MTTYNAPEIKTPAQWQLERERIMELVRQGIITAQQAERDLSLSNAQEQAQRMEQVSRTQAIPIETKPSVAPVVKTAETAGPGRAEWLKTNPEPAAFGSKDWADWARKNPYATPAEKNALVIQEKRNYVVPQTAAQQEQRAEEVNAQYTNVTAYDSKGNPAGLVQVAVADMDKTMLLNPGERLPDFIKMGILPKGTTLITDVKAFNKEFGTNISPDAPYALPDMEKEIVSFEKTKGEYRVEVNKYKVAENRLKKYIDADGMLDIQGAIKAGVKDADIILVLGGTGQAEITVMQAHRDIDDFKKELAKQPQELRDAYKKGGLSAYNAAVEKYNDKVQGHNVAIGMAPMLTTNYATEAQIAQQEAALVKLKDYKIIYATKGYGHPVEGPEDTTPKSGLSYDIDKFIHDHPDQEGISTIRAAGFNEKVVDAAKSYIDGLNKTLADIESRLKQSKYGDTPQLIALDMAMGNAGVKFNLPYKEKVMQGGVLVIYDPKTDEIINDKELLQARWDSLSQADKNRVAGFYGEDLYKNSYFAEYNHIIEQAAAGGGMIGGMIFAPVLGITSPIAKQVTGQKVTAMEWVNAAATAVLDFLIVGGGGIIPAALRGPVVVGLSTSVGGVFTYETIKNWRSMSNPEKALAVTMDVLLFIPLLAAARRIIKEPNLATKQREVVGKIFENDRAEFKKTVTNDPRNPKNTPNEFDVKYQKWLDDLREYSEAKIELEQAQKVISDIKFAKTKGELELLRRAQEKIDAIKTRFPDLIENAKASGKAFIEFEKDVMKINDASVLEKLERLHEGAIKDMDAIAEQIVNPRSVKTIKADIDAAIREIAGLKTETLKRVTIPEGKGGYLKSVNSGIIRRTDLLNRLNQELYYAKLGQTERLYQNSFLADQLVKKIEATGSPQLKAKLQLQLDDIRAKNIELKQQFAESLYKTTEPMERYTQKGGGEKALYERAKDVTDYGRVMYKLDYMKNLIKARIKDVELADKLTKDLEALEKAYSKGDVAGIKVATESLAKENPNIRVRLNSYLERINKAAADREAAVKKWQEAKAEGNAESIRNWKKAVDDATRESTDVLKETADDIKQQHASIDKYDQAHAEWRKFTRDYMAEETGVGRIAEEAKLSEAKQAQARNDRFDRLLTDKERSNISRWTERAERTKKDAEEATEYARQLEDKYTHTNWESIIPDEKIIREMETSVKNVDSKGYQIYTEKGYGAYLKEKMRRKVEESYTQAEKESNSAADFARMLKEEQDKLYADLADKYFKGDRNALDDYIEKGKRGEVELESGIDETQVPKTIPETVKEYEIDAALKEIDDMFKRSRGKDLDAALKEIDDILKDNPELKSTLDDIERELKKIREGLEKPREGKPTSGGKRVAVKEKTETRPKTKEELEKELYKEEKTKPAERMSEEARKKLEKAKEAAKAKPIAKPLALPLSLPKKKTGPGHQAETLEAVKSQPLTKIKPQTKVEEITKPIPTVMPAIGPQTQTEAETQALVAAQPAIKTEIQPAATPQPEPQPQTKPLTKTQIKTATAIKVAPVPEIQVRPETKPEPVIPPIIPVKTPIPPKVPPPEKPIKLPPPGSSDEKKRKAIKKYPGGKVSWNMGKLGGKDVWWTRFDDGKELVVLGKPPEGTKILADGPGSAYKTTQRIGKKRPFEPFSRRHGAVMVNITPSKSQQGAQAAFSPIGRSHKEGKMYVTNIGGATGYSRRPIKKRRGKR